MTTLPPIESRGAALPIGVTRLLAVAALRDGVGIDEYIATVLTEHALELTRREAMREKFQMKREHITATQYPNWKAGRKVS